LEVLSIMGISNHFYNFKRHILPLIEQNLIEYTKKENSKDRNQKYVTTQKGNSRLKG
jgi:ATP-dependent DNA helicase RecG